MNSNHLELSKSFGALLIDFKEREGLGYPEMSAILKGAGLVQFLEPDWDVTRATVEAQQFMTLMKKARNDAFKAPTAH